MKLPKPKQPANLLLCLLLLWLATAPLVAQTLPVEVRQPSPLQFSHSIAIGSPIAVSVDRNNSIYIVDRNRNLTKLDSLGQVQVVFSPPSKGRPSSVEAWNPMKVLLFYEDRQEIMLLDRFMRPISQTSLADYGYTGTIKAATLSSDDSFWIYNESDFTLSKLDQRFRKANIETSLGLILDRERLDVRQLREYQNMLYMLDANGGVFIFDNLGNYKSKLPVAGLSYFNFKENELYYLKDNRLHFYDLYKQQTRSINLPEEKNYRYALTGNRHIYLFTDKEVEIYTLLP
ncbi:hypothetical protein FVR03_06505 [Pontibacter qinzhouensis]|uniref:6-bladed beta-propeller n=1 Tax=Pontibacter qinzhouensis TaxID=2603253 RepID=A0A5C8KAQ2_9BACT|nr:hypothetical protein [Pontibacter qinzhouensis]TXK49383.1 hypothetical protein FVR03_06505 [Pontibacter qinzhouensis]